MDRAHRPRHRALAVALATLLVPLVVGSAAAAPGNRPAVTVTPTVTGANVSVRADVNRGTNQIASCTYVLDAHAPVWCGTAAANGKKDSRYTISLTSQAVGGHTIAVTVRLTDGGSGSGSASFTIAPPRVFVTAWSNLDSVVGYQAGGSDALIAQVEDTNGTNAVDAGDTLRTSSFPADLVGSSRIALGVTSHVITGVIAADTVFGVLLVGSGAGYSFRSDSYFEQNTSSGVSSRMAESSGTCSLSVFPSPSQPVTTVPFQLGACASGWVDVSFDLPS